MRTAVATDPLSVYAAALYRHHHGRQAMLVAFPAGGDGPIRWYDVARWSGEPVAGDAHLLDRCTGPTLDVGCGAGRLTAELARRGEAALGVDISPVAIQLARSRGAAVLRRDVFMPLPGEGRWCRVLLADGNVGIGGDPARLLRRCRELLTAGGELLVESEPPGSETWAGDVRISTVDGKTSTPFSWAYVALDDLVRLGQRESMCVRTIWTEAGRWFARLAVR